MRFQEFLMEAERYVVDMPSPVGLLTLTASDTELISVTFPDHKQTWGSGQSPSRRSNAVLDAAREQLEAYFAGRLQAFDLPLAMDRTHLAAMRWMAPRDLQDRPTLLMKFAPEVGIDEISDPYGGPARGYEEALNLIEAACRGLLAGFQSEFKAARSG